MTPRECLQMQVENEFLGTFGCREHEMIAARILLKLAMYNHWRINFDRKEVLHPEQDRWEHSHTGCDLIPNPCSFDKYVTYTNEAKTQFQVNRRFIENVRKNKSGRSVTVQPPADISILDATHATPALWQVTVEEIDNGKPYFYTPVVEAVSVLDAIEVLLSSRAPRGRRITAVKMLPPKPERVPGRCLWDPQGYGACASCCSHGGCEKNGGPY